MAEVETQQKRAAGATKLTDNLLKDFSSAMRGQILEFAVKRIKQGLSESGVKAYVYSLRILKRNGANLYDPESVKEVIARMEVSKRYKSILVDAYDAFLKSMGGKWEKPKYTYAPKLPFIPLETEIDQLIAGCSKTVGAFLQTDKETGARRGEIAKLNWSDFDFERKIVAINEPEKGSDSRQIKVSPKLIAMVNRLPRRTLRVFRIESITKQFFRQRKRIADKLNNPRILAIGFHTLRHWKGTMEYHKTKDIMYVKYVLGHRNIRNTMIYINLESTAFQQDPDQFHVRVAQDPEEIKSLLEVGFEYVCQKDALLFFKKRK